MATTFDVEQLLVTESGRISGDIYRRTLNTSPWLKLVSQDKWPDELGTVINTLTYERSLPIDGSGLYVPQTWTTLSANALGGNSGNCAPTANRVNWGTGTRTYQLEQSALESPDVCLNDLRFAVNRKSQLSNIMQILTENTRWVWQERFREEYTRISQNKIVLQPTSSTLGAGEGVDNSKAIGTNPNLYFAESIPTSQLTDGALKRVYMRSLREGAGENPMDRQDGRPVLALICSSETSDAILKSNTDLRTDFRYSSRVNELLAPLGVERSYNGFFHLIDDFPPRWDFNSGAASGSKWIRRHPYIGSVATARGKKLEINPAYETALYEDSFIFHKDVFTNLVPGTITSPGAGMQFDPMQYRGDWIWRNIPDRTTNPDGLIGYFRGVFQMGSQPILPQFGYVIRHLRCGIPATAVAC